MPTIDDKYLIIMCKLLDPSLDPSFNDKNTAEQNKIKSVFINYINENEEFKVLFDEIKTNVDKDPNSYENL